MEPVHEDPIVFFKELESKLNHRIHEMTNNRAFTKAFGNAMEAHLIQLQFYKKRTMLCLKKSDLPNKDDIANISIRMVEIEDSLDLFDEALYLLKRTQQNNRTQMKLVLEAYKDLFILLETEIEESKRNKFVTLKEDLLGLKQLFL